MARSCTRVEWSCQPAPRSLGAGGRQHRALRIALRVSEKAVRATRAATGNECLRPTLPATFTSMVRQLKRRDHLPGVRLPVRRLFLSRRCWFCARTLLSARVRGWPRRHTRRWCGGGVHDGDGCGLWVDEETKSSNGRWGSTLKVVLSCHE